VIPARLKLYLSDPVTWLLGDKSCNVPQQVFTQDEHDPSIAAKPFPDKEYIRWIVKQWQSARQNLWEKSRQVIEAIPG
jgi:hypothetical protein